MAQGLAQLAEIRLGDAGVYLVTTVTTSIYRVDLAGATVERVGGYKRLEDTPSDGAHRLRTLNRVRVGERGQWTLHRNADDPDDGLIWYITSNVVSIVAIASPPTPLEPETHFLGPTMTEASICARLDLTTSEVNQLVLTDQLLRVITADGIELYPAFQVGNDDTLLPGLADVIAELSSGTTDEWTWWQYLVTPTEKRNGKAIWQILREHRIDDAIRDAGQAAWAWRP
ncbi:hypothetical protein ACFQ9V_13270 [Leifsonia sp. NPDC056665]|uniref:hypothetical protein n=1 Tax=Leifsonia sp. NPDC056665 TaxID=3345901 RepID=UPI0036856F40